jgi:ubiquinol-cytochrome c reductase cytochrome b subunit/menaquinol-cytochrome c reductase cytochrome b subunit
MSTLVPPPKEIVQLPVDWVEERSGLVSVGKYFLFRNVPKDISWLQTLGASLLTVFIVQVTTGILLAMYYKPDPDAAFASIRYITDEATLGWLVRGMHKWGSSVMVILLFLHMGRVFVFGAYKYPREMTWVTGAVIFILVMMMSLTGYLLVFDQRAYWATVVAININGTAPIVGPYLTEILNVGPEFSTHTLSRFYSLHMLVIPSLIGGLIALHLWLVVRLGVTSPPWSKHRVKDGDA